MNTGSSGNQDQRTADDQPVRPADDGHPAATTVAPLPTQSLAPGAEITDAQADPAPMPALPGYEILDELGRGGMGVVYKARHLRLNRLVALKMVLVGGHAGAADLRRFKLEAEAVASFQHPHIVQIYEISEHEGRPFVALEYVDGGSLARKLAAGPLGFQEAARIIEALASAVEHAHRRGILHRDIKPANVLVMSDGTAKITDFGLAKRLEGPGVTQSGHNILGTPSYMAPEQAEGKPEKIGPTSDIYGLGATLYEMLAGRPPYRENTTLDTILKVVQEDPPPPSRWRPDLPHDLETICLKCMQRKSGQRYASAAALADDLRRFLQDEPILARPPGKLERLGRWLKRRREHVALAVGGLGLIALLAVALWPAPPSPSPKITPDLKSAKEPEAPPELPAELALVPRDGFGFATVKVGEILGREGLDELYKEITKVLPVAPPAEFMAAEVEKAIGVRPGDMDRLTLIFAEPTDAPAKGKTSPIQPDMVHSLLDDDIMSAAVLTTVVPYDRAKILASFPEAWHERQHKGRSYLVSAGRWPLALYFFDPHTFAAALSETKMQDFFERIPATESRGPLDDALARASKSPLVIGLHPPARGNKELGEEATKILESFWTMQGKKSADMLPKVRSMLDLESVTMTMDWLFRTSVGDAIKFDLFLTYADEPRARQGLEGVNLVQSDVVFVLKKGREVFKLKTVPEFAPLAEFLDKVYGELEYAVQAAEIHQESRTVQVQLRMRFDIPKLLAESKLATAAGIVKAAANRTVTFRKLQELAMALRAYNTKHGRLPAAAVYAGDGRPLLSWRVAVLPFLGEKKLHDEFNLHEAWDSPHNKKLLAKMPSVFAPARGSTKLPHVTYFQVLVGPGAAFEGNEGTRLADFTDGAETTILIVEAAPPVPWTKPADLSYAPTQSPKLGPLLDQGWAAALADGAVRVLSRKTSEADLRALITRNGGEKIDLRRLP